MVIKKNNYRVGILGGMGPMAGVLLQKLIIENTPAQKDQDHIQMVCFTNPQIPDRTEFLRKNKNKELAIEIIKSIKVLEKSNVDLIVIACNTAHACLKEVQKSTSIPILNIVKNTFENLGKSKINSVGILATEGTIESNIFSHSRIKILYPDIENQKKIMSIIYRIKSGKHNDSKIILEINRLIKHLKSRGAQKIIFACTELSIYFPIFKNKDLVDPLILIAQKIVKLSKNKKFN